jgi:hypothetical protein
MAQDALLKSFMPPDTAQSQKAQPKNATPPRKPQQKPSDRESDPAVKDARDLCDYAWKTIEDIYKDYQGSLAEWEKQFGGVLAAVGIANAERDATMQDVKEERAQDAARAAFINNLLFSLLTVGSMAYLGAFVAAGLPKLRFGKAEHDFVDASHFVDGFKSDKYFAEKVFATNKVVLKSPVQFNEFQATVFGDIVKDSGTLVAPLTFPKPPEIVPYRIDSPGGLESLRADFNKNVQESKQLVLGEFKKVQQWLNQESEFGEAWLAHTRGNKAQARNEILRHITTLRNRWADKWEFFGKTPFLVSRGLVAQLYERAWWASYIIKALTIFPYNKEMTPESEHFGTMVQLGRGGRKLLERAIVDKLRKLNVVFAESPQAVVEQLLKADRLTPVPEFRVEGAIESEDAAEALAAYRWAKSFVEKASAEAALRYFPPAKARKLDPLRAASY